MIPSSHGASQGAGFSPTSSNPGIGLDRTWLQELSVPESWVRDRARALRTGAPGPRAASMPDLVRLLEALDLTTLAGDDTEERVRELARRARAPLPPDLLDRLPSSQHPPRVAAACVFPVFLPAALEVLGGSGVRVATVAGGFPHGLSPLEARIREVEVARAEGAHEIDVVIRRQWALEGRWERLYQEIVAFRETAGARTLKVILATGELGNPERIARAATVAMMAGADFVKTSTGKETVNATLEAGLAMTRALALYRERTGFLVGLKPAGGIREAAEAMVWLHLVREELGEEAGNPGRFRIGASSLLDRLVEALSERSRFSGDPGR